MGSTSEQLMAHHPLQKLQSPSRGVSAIVHLLGLLSFSLSYKYLLDFPTFINESYGWHFQYLTIIGLTIAFLTFAFGLLYVISPITLSSFSIYIDEVSFEVLYPSLLQKPWDCQRSSAIFAFYSTDVNVLIPPSADLTLSPTLFLLKNGLSLCSAPLEVLISVLYWGISAIDKTLLVPPEIHISPYADIGFHAMPAIMLTIDLLFLSPPWTIHAVPAMGLSSVLAVSYWAWVEQCYKYNGLYIVSFPFCGMSATNFSSQLPLSALWTT